MQNETVKKTGQSPSFQSVDKVLLFKIQILKKKNMLWINGGRKTLVFLPPSPHL